MSPQALLATAGVRYEKFAGWPSGGVFLTAANQLLGTFSDLKRFQSVDRDYFGWHAHHIVEAQDLERLGVAHHFPAREQQLCVLLPERAHVGRINSVLRRQNPANIRVTANELRRAYADAYALVGDYCGGGQGAIRQELLALVNATFRAAGL
jgi:hypothetical protein